MKEKVYVNIKGLHLTVESDENEEDAVEVINIGRYKVVNGKEYIKYEETIEGEKKKCTNTIKIDKDTVEITKKGPVTAHMSFEMGNKTMTFYETPFGSLYLGIFSRRIDIERQEDKINISIDYSLELNYEQVSDCKVQIEIMSAGKFSLK